MSILVLQLLNGELRESCVYTWPILPVAAQFQQLRDLHSVQEKSSFGRNSEHSASHFDMCIDASSRSLREPRVDVTAWAPLMDHAEDHEGLFGSEGVRAWDTAGSLRWRHDFLVRPLDGINRQLQMSGDGFPWQSFLVHHPEQSFPIRCRPCVRLPFARCFCLRSTQCVQRPIRKMSHSKVSP